MYSMPQAYKDGIQDADRIVQVSMSIGIGIDQTAVDDLTGISGDFLPMSNTIQTIDMIYDATEGMATFEGDGIKTSADSGMVAPPLGAMRYPPEIGVWTSGISDGEGNIDETIVLSLSAPHTSALKIYTDGPSVVQATASFSLDGTVETVNCDCIAGSFGTTEIKTYDTITINVSKIDRPYCHVRVIEVEFGSSVTFSSSAIAGEITNICELDPTESTIPMNELDFSLINVQGDFDTDNPVTRLDEVRVGYPIILTYMLNGSTTRFTVPGGRYYIGKLMSLDTRISVTAFDARWILSQSYITWGISTEQSFGLTLDNLLRDLDVPHSIDADLMDMYPTEDYTFDDSTSVLDDLLDIQQAYAIYLVPSRDETLHITTMWPSGDAGAINPGAIYSWPAPMQSTRYNYISVAYGEVNNTQYVTLDMRADAGEPKSILNIAGNPLILTADRATTVVNRLASRLSSTEIESEWMGDPAMEVGDSVDIPGRWTQDSPMKYTITYTENTFDGALKTVLRGAR